MIRIKTGTAAPALVALLAAFGIVRANSPPNTWQQQLAYLHGVVEGACSSIPPAPEYWYEYVGCMNGMWTGIANQYATLAANMEAACSTSSPPANCAAWIDYYGNLADEAAAQSQLWSSS